MKAWIFYDPLPGSLGVRDCERWVCITASLYRAHLRRVRQVAVRCCWQSRQIALSQEVKSG